MSVNRSITATTTIPLGNASEGDVSRWIVQFTGSDTPSYSIAVNKRATTPTGVTANSYVAGYYLLDSDGSATSGALVVTTTSKIIQIDAAGCDVQLICTKTTGTLKIDANPIRG